MGSVPRGPGQTEVTGDLHDPQVPNVPGTYKDPVSGAVVTTMAPAGADALVRMGFELQAYEPEVATPVAVAEEAPVAPTEVPAEAPAEAIAEEVVAPQEDTKDSAPSA